MISTSAIIQTSLSDPPPAGVIAPATSWIMDLIFGPLATSIAVIAVAWVGFALLSGRVDIRRGLAVIFGCFLLFGAQKIATGLHWAAANGGGNEVATVPPPPSYSLALAAAPASNAFDHYVETAGSPLARETDSQ